MKWNHIIESNGSELWMPDLASLIADRLAKPAKLLSSNHSAQKLGESILRQLHEVRDSTGGLRLSQSGTCIRQLAYQYHHAEESGLGIDAASKLAFIVGDTTEAILVSALMEAFEESGAGTLFGALNEQEEVMLQVPIKPGHTAKISGHPDGSMVVMTQSSEPIHAILEVKSMSEYGFGKFRKEGLGPDDSYYNQVQSYMASKGYEWAYLVAYSKTAGAKDAEVFDDGSWLPVSALHGQWIKYDAGVVVNIKDKFRRVVQSIEPEDIERPHGPDKKGRLSFPCDYCRYYKRCFPFAEEHVQESRWLKKSHKIKVSVGEDRDQ
jgi:hypothetical protein